MELAATPQQSVWHRIDGSAFGLVYGTITALGILMAMGAHPEHPFEMAAALFGSVLAVTLVKAFAEVMAEELAHDGQPSPLRLGLAWRHARPTLVTANVPTLLLVAAGLGLLGAELAIGLAQGFSVLVLLGLGGRVGWVARRSLRGLAFGALFSGGIGLALAALKYVLH